MMKNIGIFLNIETTSRHPVATGNLEYNERIYYCLFNSDITGGRRQNIVLINEEGVPIYGPVDKSAIGYSMELRPMALLSTGPSRRTLREEALSKGALLYMAMYVRQICVATLRSRAWPLRRCTANPISRRYGYS